MSFRRIIIPVLAMLIMPLAAMAQEQQGGENNRGGGGRNWDPAQVRQQILDRLKTDLKTSDEEWQVLQPKLDKLMTAQWSARSSRFGRGGRGGGTSNNIPETELSRAQQALDELLKTENPNAADIEAKLTAYRAARDKAQAELDAARQDVLGLLTKHQEAVLVLNGMLE